METVKGDGEVMEVSVKRFTGGETHLSLSGSQTVLLRLSSENCVLYRNVPS